MCYIKCTYVITDDTVPNGDGAYVMTVMHLLTPYSYKTRLVRVKALSAA